MNEPIEPLLCTKFGPPTKLHHHDADEQMMAALLIGRPIVLQNMERNADLSRAILQCIEEHSHVLGGLEFPLSVEGYGAANVLAHAATLIEEGYVHGKVASGLFGAFLAMVTHLTDRGEEALRAIDNEATWQSVKQSTQAKGLPLTFDLGVAIAEQHIQAHPAGLG